MPLERCPVCDRPVPAHSTDPLILDDGQRGHVSCTAKQLGLPWPDTNH